MRSTAAALAIALPIYASLTAALGCHDVVDLAQGTGLDSLAVADTGTADGASLTAVKAFVDTTLPLSQRAVTVTTTAGLFTLGGQQTVTVIADSVGRATAYLRAPRDSALAQISASTAYGAGGEVKTRIVVFHRASVQAISVIPASCAVSAGPKNSLSVSAYLLRVIGRPSPGVILVFAATDSSGAPRGGFTAALPSDSSGVVAVSFSSADTLFHGHVIISTHPRGDSTVVGQATILVTP